jgi:rare lipoprotein A
MTRLLTSRTRAVVAPVAAGALMLGLATAAIAQSATPQPEIDSAPKVVRFERTATIRGHLENGNPGDEVTLQQRRGDDPWRNVSTKMVDENGDVRFRRQDMRRTTSYRLSWSDQIQEIETTSDPVRVRVKPRFTLRLSPNDVFQGRTVRASGRLRPAVSGRQVRAQKKVDGEWRSIGRTAVRDGRFNMSFEARPKGNRRVRIIFSGDSVNAGASRTRSLTVYRADRATWYGPGFYGNRTACGKRLSGDTLGVAHRTLPCGTKVSILYRGRTISVPVIDRGPYTSANWDLTEETAERLGFSGRDTVGVTR